MMSDFEVTLLAPTSYIVTGLDTNGFLCSFFYRCL